MLRLIAYPAIAVVVGVSVAAVLILGSTIPALTPAFTILLGVLAFLVGQFVLRFVFEPVVELRRTIGKVGYALAHYGRVYTRPGPPVHFVEESELRGKEPIQYKIEVRAAQDRGKATREFRRFGSLLRAQHKAIVWAWMARGLRLCPSAENITAASKELMGLSNNIEFYPEIHPDWSEKRHRISHENRERRAKIRELLGLPDED